MRFKIDDELSGMAKAGLAIFAAALGGHLAFALYRKRTALGDIGPTDLEERVGRGDVVVVDVRSDLEYARGHIPGAISAPLGSVKQHLDEIPVDRDVVLICQTGHRSVVAARTLTEEGYMRLYHLPAGMNSWRGAITRG